MQRELRLLDMALAYGPHAFTRLRAVFYLYAHAAAAFATATLKPKRERVVHKPQYLWVGRLPDHPGQVILCFDPNRASEIIIEVNPAAALCGGADLTRYGLEAVAEYQDQVGVAEAERQSRHDSGRRLDS